MGADIVKAETIINLSKKCSAAVANFGYSSRLNTISFTDYEMFLIKQLVSKSGFDLINQWLNSRFIAIGDLDLLLWKEAMLFERNPMYDNFSLLKQVDKLINGAETLKYHTTN